MLFVEEKQISQLFIQEIAIQCSNAATIWPLMHIMGKVMKNKFRTAQNNCITFC